MAIQWPWRSAPVQVLHFSDEEARTQRRRLLYPSGHLERECWHSPWLWAALTQAFVSEPHQRRGRVSGREAHQCSNPVMCVDRCEFKVACVPSTKRGYLKKSENGSKMRGCLSYSSSLFLSGPSEAPVYAARRLAINLYAAAVGSFVSTIVSLRSLLSKVL